MSGKPQGHIGADFQSCSLGRQAEVEVRHIFPLRIIVLQFLKLTSAKDKTLMVSEKPISGNLLIINDLLYV